MCIIVHILVLHGGTRPFTFQIVSNGMFHNPDWHLLSLVVAQRVVPLVVAQRLAPLTFPPRPASSVTCRSTAHGSPYLSDYQQWDVSSPRPASSVMGCSTARGSPYITHYQMWDVSPPRPASSVAGRNAWFLLPFHPDRRLLSLVVAQCVVPLTFQIISCEMFRDPDWHFLSWVVAQRVVPLTLHIIRCEMFRHPDLRLLSLVVTRGSSYLSTQTGVFCRWS